MRKKTTRTKLHKQNEAILSVHRLREEANVGTSFMLAETLARESVQLSGEGERGHHNTIERSPQHHRVVTTKPSISHLNTIPA